MKVKPLNPDCVAAARRVLAEADVREPHDIHIEAIAARRGAMVLYGPQTTARGSIVRAGIRSVIRIDERAMGKPWGRFTAAHEFAHHEMHTMTDHYEQCDLAAGRKKDQAAYKIERQADAFAAELLIPEFLGAPLCAMANPSFDDVERLARTFTTSLEMSSIRMVQLATAACAAVLSVHGEIKWAPETAAFPGRVYRGREVHGQSAAARAQKRVRGDEPEREVPGEAWGGKGPFRELAIRMGEGKVLSWIVPA